MILYFSNGQISYIIYIGPFNQYACLWSCLASAGGLNLLDKRVNSGFCLKSGFESPRGQLVVNLFRDPISYGRFTGATLYMPCLDRGLIYYINFQFLISFPFSLVRLGNISWTKHDFFTMHSNSSAN